MSTPSATEKMFTAAGAAKACKVGRSTVMRYLEQDRLPGAERDADGVWQIPLSALLSVGWTPGRSAPTVDGDRERDRDKTKVSDRHVSREVHELALELERARAEARAQSAKVDALERVLAVYERQIEQGKQSQAPLDAPQTHVQPEPVHTHAPDPVRPSTGRPPTLREYARARFNVWRYRQPDLASSPVYAERGIIECMGMNRIRRKDLKRKRDPLEGKKPEEIDWAAREARARAQMDRARARTLSGEDYAAKAPSTYRRTGRRDPGAIS